MTQRLKYRWREAINRLEFEPTPYPQFKLRPVIDFADWFVAKWGDYAELAKMQPVHLLRNDHESPASRGLAWRWTPNMDVLCFPRERILCAESWRPDNTAILFVYEFHPDGRTTHVFGARRAEIIGSAPALAQTLPLTRQRVLSGQGGHDQDGGSV